MIINQSDHQYHQHHHASQPSQAATSTLNRFIKVSSQNTFTDQSLLYAILCNILVIFSRFDDLQLNNKCFLILITASLIFYGFSIESSWI